MLHISRDKFLPQISKVNGLMAITPSFLNQITVYHTLSIFIWSIGACITCLYFLFLIIHVQTAQDPRNLYENCVPKKGHFGGGKSRKNLVTFRPSNLEVIPESPKNHSKSRNLRSDTKNLPQNPGNQDRHFFPETGAEWHQNHLGWHCTVLAVCLTEELCEYGRKKANCLKLARQCQ